MLGNHVMERPVLDCPASWTSAILGKKEKKEVNKGGADRGHPSAPISRVRVGTVSVFWSQNKNLSHNNVG